MLEPGGDVVFELPPQPIAPAVKTIPRRINHDIERRRRAGMPSISAAARTAPPPPSPHRDGRTSAALVAAVVFTVKTVVPLPPEVSVTLAGFRLHVGRL